MRRKLWVIYDERAQTMSTDDCSVLESCGSLADVRRSHFDGGRLGPLGIVFEYDVTDGSGLVNERRLGTVAELKAKQS
jgi:hypothetical protein